VHVFVPDYVGSQQPATVPFLWPTGWSGRKSFANLEGCWIVRCARCHMCVTLYPNLTFNMDMTEDALRAAMTAARSKGDVFSGEEVGT
jgi:hypothetical protein